MQLARHEFLERIGISQTIVNLCRVGGRARLGPHHAGSGACDCSATLKDTGAGGALRLPRQLGRAVRWDVVIGSDSEGRDARDLVYAPNAAILVPLPALPRRPAPHIGGFVPSGNVRQPPAELVDVGAGRDVPRLPCGVLLQCLRRILLGVRDVQFHVQLPLLRGLTLRRERDYVRILFRRAATSGGQTVETSSRFRRFSRYALVRFLILPQMQRQRIGFVGRIVFDFRVRDADVG